VREEIINPNWHVILVHYPLALLTLGVVIEVLALLWRKSSARTAAKWMILLGTLSMVPTATMGLYAFKDVASGASSQPDAPWDQLTSNSQWTTDQWTFMKRHILWQSGATAMCLVVVLMYLSSSDAWRRGLHLPLLSLLVIAVALASGGAYWSGEAVYRHKVAVEPQSTETTVGTAVSGNESMTRWSDKVSPLQLHLLLAGFTISVAWAALGLTFRKWALEPGRGSEQEVDPEVREREERLMIMGPTPGQRPKDPMHKPEAPPKAVPAARFWMLALVLALLTAAAGVWYTEGMDWTSMRTARNMLTQGASSTERAGMTLGQKQLLYHILLGGAVVVLPLLLAALTRLTRSKVITTLFALVLVGAVGLQVWMGILLLYQLPFRGWLRM
jgi:uncharacterized membrane protein